MNRPNLNLLGRREPELYGTVTLAEIETRCRALAAERGLGMNFRQSNHEGALVDAVQEGADGIVINPAACAHGYELALLHVAEPMGEGRTR
ncbi:type II 3-dehydroquinate dehydratase [Spirillospora sp. CA-255316]